MLKSKMKMMRVSRRIYVQLGFILGMLVSFIAVANIKDEALRVVWKDLRPAIDKHIVSKHRSGELAQNIFDDYMERYGRQIVTEFDNKLVKVPGYLVPLNMNEDLTATKFLLVSTPGACVHLPPPSPNQIIYIEYDKGLPYEETATYPYWVYGKLTSKMQTSEYSDAMYSMHADLVTDYITW